MNREDTVAEQQQSVTWIRNILKPINGYTGRSEGFLPPTEV